MNYRKLGRTGLDCSVLGFGTWQIGGGRWKGSDPNDAIRLLQTSRDNGINLFDVSLVYGQYRNEFAEKRSKALELIGKAFRSKRQEIIVNLKIGQVDEYSHKSDYNPKALVQQVQTALRVLNTDYVDLCLIHAPTILQIREGVALAIVETLQAMGVVRFIGYSFEAEAEHAKVALSQNIDVIMLQYNILEEACADVFDLAKSAGVGVLVGGPFRRGYLTGRFNNISDLPIEDNYWEWNIRYSREKVETLLAQVTVLKEKAGGAQELRRLALEHILRHPGACSAVVGHRQENEVLENISLTNEFLKHQPTLQ